jgi:hypothetical protein
MADREAITSGGSEKGVGGSGERVPEIKEGKEVKTIVQNKEKRQKFLFEWKRNSENSKDQLKKKLVGGSKKYKKELDDIFDSATKELEKIRSKPEAERVKLLNQLEKDQERRVSELIERVGKEAANLTDKEAGKLAKKEGVLIWSQVEVVDKLYFELEKEANKEGRADQGRLVELQNRLKVEQTKLQSQVSEFDFKDPINIRVFWEEGVKAEIEQMRVEVDGAPAYRDLNKQLQLLETKLQMPSVNLGENEFRAIIEKAYQEKGEGLISDDELELVITKVKEIAEKTRNRKIAKKAGSFRKEDYEKIDQEKVEQFKKDNQWVQNFNKREQERLAILNSKPSEELVEMIGKDDDMTANVNSLIEKLEKPEVRKRNNEAEAAMRATVELRNGDIGSLAKNFDAWAEARESTLRHTQVIRDAKREVVVQAIKRMEFEGTNDPERMRVVDEDIEEWVLTQMSKVVGGGEGVTGYSARQYMMEVAGITEPSDLGFEDIISEMYGSIMTEADYESVFENKRKLPSNISKQLSEDLGSKVLLIRDMPVFLSSEEVSKIEMFTRAKHEPRAKDGLRDTASSAIASFEMFSAYNNSGSIEDMVRPSSHYQTQEFAHLLHMESVGRRVEGRLSFYQVEVDEKTGKRKMFSRGNLSEDVFKRGRELIHTAEINKGGLNLEVMTAGGERVVIGMDDFDNLLWVGEGEVKISTGEVVDILNQERFAIGAMHRNEKMRGKFEREAGREAIMHSMGLVDLDGEINWGKVNQLIVKRYGEGSSFKLIDQDNKEVSKDPKRVRVKMVLDRVGGKVMNHTIGNTERHSMKIDKKDVGFYLNGIVEDGDNLDDMFNEYKMMFKLASGFWQSTGLSIGHWDKDHSGNSRDWHLKILNFIQYCQMYGIGPPHLRKNISLDYHDFITRRKGDIIPALFGKHTKAGLKDSKKGSEDAFHRGELINCLVLDRDGFVMSRQRMLDIFGRYKDLKSEGVGDKAEEHIYSMFLEKAIARFGKVKGNALVKKHWKGIKNIDYSGFIKDQSGLEHGDMKGFDGLYWWAKRHYKYGDLNWGGGSDVSDTTWSQRWYKEAQYLFTADKYRGAMIGWLTGKPESTSAYLEATSAPGWYGQSDQNRKNVMLKQSHEEYFMTRKLLDGPMDTVWHDPDSLSALGPSQDEWDGSMRYKQVKVMPGKCLGKEQRGIGPFNRNESGRNTEAMLRAGKITSRVANELKWKSGTGKTAEKINYILDSTPILNAPGIKHVLKLANASLFGATIHEKFITIGDKKYRVLGERYMLGIVGWLFKKWKVWWENTLAARKEMLRGALEATGEQLKGLAKVD